MASLSEKDKMLAGQLYRADDPVLAGERKRARELTRRYNSSEDDHRLRFSLLEELLGSVGEGSRIEPDFRCDYGYNLHVGDDFYANFGLIALDVCEIRIGDNALLGPRVNLVTATHPLDAGERLTGKEYGQPIRIGDNAWIGAAATINPGVSLGDNVVVASGAVVTRSFGSKVLIGGVPAKVIRELG